MNPRLLVAATVGIGTLTFFAACSGPKVADYVGKEPALDLREYFNGTIDGYGLITDRWGKVTRRFRVVMRGRWNGDEGVLDEEFSYADGSTEQRTWKLTRLPDGRYVGNAGDVVGKADGVARGNVFAWQYTLAVPIDGKTWNIDFDDWLYLIDDRVLLNKAEMTKWGVRVGDMTASFVKRP